MKRMLKSIEYIKNMRLRTKWSHVWQVKPNFELLKCERGEREQRWDGSDERIDKNIEIGSTQY